MVAATKRGSCVQLWWSPPSSSLRLQPSGDLGQPEPVSPVDVELRWYRTNGEGRAVAFSTMAVDRCWLAVQPRGDANATHADGELLFVRLSRDGMGDALWQRGAACRLDASSSVRIPEHDRIAERAGRYGRGTQGRQ